MGIMDILGSVISGGVTGVLGSVISGIISYKSKQLEYKHELAMEKAAQDTMKLEWEQRTKVAEIESETKRTAAEYEAFTESIKADKATYSTAVRFEKLKLGWLYALMMVTVDFSRGMVRPASTALFSIMTFVIYFSLKHQINSVPNLSDEVIKLFGQTVTMILYLASTTLCWWFGARGISKFNNTK